MSLNWPERTVIKHALPIPPGRNDEIIANRGTERSATPLGEQPEFETYCNFVDFPIVVSRKRIVFLIAPTRKINRISTSNHRPKYQYESTPIRGTNLCALDQ